MFKILFSDKIKFELLESPTDKYNNVYQFIGMVLFVKNLKVKKIEIASENKEVILAYKEQMLKLADVDVTYKKELLKNKTLYKILSLDEKQNIKLLEYIATIYNKKMPKNYLNSFIRGSFIACGYIANPKNKYYLEFNLPNKDLTNILNKYLKISGFMLKYKTINGKHILYFTNSDLIEDFLTYIGATKSSLEIMNIKVYKDLRNKVNRLVNCETSNINKIVSASSYQIKCINKIIEKKGLNYLDDNLKVVALKRLNNPQMPLSELILTLPFNISKSGLNHRLKKIEKIAEDI